jgi:hypothetical protein
MSSPQRKALRSIMRERYAVHHSELGAASAAPGPEDDGPSQPAEPDNGPPDGRDGSSGPTPGHTDTRPGEEW